MRLATDPPQHHQHLPTAVAALCEATRSAYHARALERVNPFKTSDICGLPKVIFPSRQGCLEGKMTLGDPFEDSGVVASQQSDTGLSGTDLCLSASEGLGGLGFGNSYLRLIEIVSLNSELEDQSPLDKLCNPTIIVIKKKRSLGCENLSLDVPASPVRLKRRGLPGGFR